ncbi:MAG TPA: hypothetical protein VHX88_07340 [Solirubrobacteraceae bacterium]|nr:hypothetical protein [Solirubrobacteraceae bacterium]
MLIVAHKTAATQPLLEAVRERAAAGPATFTLLVPNGAQGLDRLVDPEHSGGDAAERVIAEATPLLTEAAGSPVESILGEADPVAAVADALNLRGFDEVIISTLSVRLSRWLRLDLPRKVAGMGVPVQTVTPGDRVPTAH